MLYYYQHIFSQKGPITMKPTWEKPKTTKVYLHAPGSNRILMLQPEGKINNLALKN